MSRIEKESQALGGQGEVLEKQQEVRADDLAVIFKELADLKNRLHEQEKKSEEQTKKIAELENNTKKLSEDLAAKEGKIEQQREGIEKLQAESSYVLNSPFFNFEKGSVLLSSETPASLLQKVDGRKVKRVDIVSPPSFDQMACMKSWPSHLVVTCFKEPLSVDTLSLLLEGDVALFIRENGSELGEEHALAMQRARLRYLGLPLTSSILSSGAAFFAALPDTLNAIYIDCDLKLKSEDPGFLPFQQVLKANKSIRRVIYTRGSFQGFVDRMPDKSIALRINSPPSKGALERLPSFVTELHFYVSDLDLEELDLCPHVTVIGINGQFPPSLIKQLPNHIDTIQPRSDNTLEQMRAIKENASIRRIVLSGSPSRMLIENLPTDRKIFLDFGFPDFTRADLEAIPAGIKTLYVHPDMLTEIQALMNQPGKPLNFQLVGQDYATLPPALQLTQSRELIIDQEPSEWQLNEVDKRKVRTIHIKFAISAEKMALMSDWLSVSKVVLQVPLSPTVLKAIPPSTKS